MDQHAVAARERGDRLEQLARGYDRVTLVQSANWGVQDRALARLSRERGWRRVLLPFTAAYLALRALLAVLTHWARGRAGAVTTTR